MAGTLELHLKKGMDLKDVELVGRQDPYCVVKVDKQSRRTKTHTDGGKNPVWDEVMEFKNVTEDSVLKIEVYDENVLLRDVLIGSCKVPLKKVTESGSEEVDAPVLTKGKQHGSITLSLKFRVGGTPSATTDKSASKGSSKPAPPGGWILPTYGDTDVKKDYDLHEVLGKGTFGTTVRATNKATKEIVAVKVISKRKLTSPDEIEDCRREVEIMHHLSGHPNVVSLKGVYEDKQNVSLVMEVCTGGELFDNIIKRQHYSEKEAAAMIRTIVGVVAHCHNMGVIHRDLKPENFLLIDRKTDVASALKATDFGLSVFFQEGQAFTDIVGSAYYVAPEVLKRNYGKEADIWSCGVMLYILLSGMPPFYGDNERKIFESIMRDPLDFNSEPWPRISAPAKDCVRKMLQRDPKRRATALEILQHEWMRENGVASDTPIEFEVLNRLQKFSAMNRLKQEALKIIARNLPLEEINGLKQIFNEIDKDKSGTLTIDEFRAAIKRKGSLMSEDELSNLMENADVNSDGTIDYEEFMAATIHAGKLQREDQLKTAFQHFDLNGDGHISREELLTCLKDLGIQDAQEIVDQVDQNSDGSIDYNEFCEMMRSC